MLTNWVLWWGTLRDEDSHFASKNTTYNLNALSYAYLIGPCIVGSVLLVLGPFFFESKYAQYDLSKHEQVPRWKIIDRLTLFLEEIPALGISVLIAKETGIENVAAIASLVFSFGSIVYLAYIAYRGYKRHKGNDTHLRMVDGDFDRERNSLILGYYDFPWCLGELTDFEKGNDTSSAAGRNACKRGKHDGFPFNLGDRHTKRTRENDGVDWDTPLNARNEIAIEIMLNGGWEVNHACACCCRCQTSGESDDPAGNESCWPCENSDKFVDGCMCDLPTLGCASANSANSANSDDDFGPDRDVSILTSTIVPFFPRDPKNGHLIQILHSGFDRKGESGREHCIESPTKFPTARILYQTPNKMY